MSWEKLGEYLNKYKKLTPPNKNKIEALIIAIEKETKQKIKNENITIQGNIVRIGGVGFSTKNIIYIKKENIINYVNKKIGEHSISDIR